jgi:hypothetical protein
MHDSPAGLRAALAVPAFPRLVNCPRLDGRYRAVVVQASGPYLPIKGGQLPHSTTQIHPVRCVCQSKVAGSQPSGRRRGEVFRDQRVGLGDAA